MERFIIKNLEESPEELKKIITQNEAALEGLLNIEDKTYENFVVPYQLMAQKLNSFVTPITHLDSVCNSPATQKAYEECLPLLSAYFTKLGQNENTLQASKDIQYKYKSILNNQQNKVLENEIRDFELSGCGLDEEKKKELEVIDLELSLLAKDFSQNLLNATKNWEMFCDEADVIGMPNDEKSRAEVISGDKKQYRFTLQAPSYNAYITYGINRSKREIIYKAYATRAPQNEELIEKIVSLKQKKAHILGFENYAIYSLATKMALNTSVVEDFLYLIAQKTKPKAIKELEELKEFAKKLDDIEDLQSYDMAYYSQKLKEEKYTIDDELYKPYFQKERTLEGVLEFLFKIFGVRFDQIEEKSWHESVLVYHLYEENECIGKIYFDLEARDEKKGGAWMHNWHDRYSFNGEKQLPTAFIVCNFSPATQSVPSLLSHDEVTTLFHELGHAVHHLFTKVDEPFVSGINGVAWDTVEFPSQFLEYFAYDKEVLRMFAKHYISGEILDDENIDKLILTRNYGSALATLRQIEFALFDFLLYQKNRNQEEVQALLDSIRKEVGVMTPPSYNKFQNGFSHIFSGGYSAGYYSYKWAEVLSADAFNVFTNSGIFDIQTGRKFKELILESGGSVDMNTLFFSFANKEPDVDSLLKIDGIIS